MKVCRSEIAVPMGELSKLESLCDGPAADCGRDEIVFDKEATFPDGRRMAIQVIAPNDLSDGCWTQGVLFDADGNELGATEVGECVAGEYIVDCDEFSYITTVVPSE